MKDIVFSSIDEVNDSLKVNIKKDVSTPLVGNIDSITLVHLLVSIEGKINKTIADDRAMSRMSSPFLTVGTLIEYCESL
jgi:acyl carrier protein